MTTLSIPPQIHELTDINFPSIDKLTLENGINLNVLHREDLKVVKITIAMRGGTAEAVNPAIALLASALQLEGTSSMTGREIADRLALTGAFTQCTSREHYRFLNCVCLYERIVDVLPILADVILNPVFPEEEFRAIQNRFALQIRTQEQSVGYQAEILSSIMSFGPSHPYSTILDHDAVRSVKVEDVRKFYERYNNPESMEVYFAGNFTKETLIAFEKTLGKITKSESNPSIHNIRPWEPSSVPKEELYSMEGKLQSAIVATIPLVNLNEEDFLKLRLSVVALGGYFGSRLQQNIREDKGWTYDISSNIRSFFKDKLFTIKTECANQYVESVIREIGKELEHLGECDVSEDELVRIRRTETSTLAEIVSTPFTTLDFFINCRTQQLPDHYFGDRLRTALSITPDDIRKMTCEYLTPDRLLIAVAGKPSN